MLKFLKKRKGVHMIAIVVLIGGLFLVLAFVAGIYNKGISLKNYVKEAFSTMDVYMKKRWDLIPNLLETAKGYMQYEKETLEKITELRNLNYGSMSNEEKMNVNNQLGLGLSKLIAVSENYPDLKANQSFNELMNSLNSVEKEIADSRKYYNGTVRELNNYTEYFPSNIIAMMFNIKPEKMFEINEEERQNVKVKF